MEEVKEEQEVAQNGDDMIQMNHGNKNEEGKVDNGGNKSELLEPSSGTVDEKANAEKSKDEEEKAEVKEESTTVDTMNCSEAKDGGDDEQDKTPSPKRDPNIGKIVESNKILPSGHMYPLQGRVVSYQE